MALRNVEFAGRFAFPDQVRRSRRCPAFAILGGAMNREDSAQGAPLATSRGDLERALGLKEAVALNMIEMVGIGPFVVIPLVIKAMGGPQCLLAWAAGAVLALLDGFVWSELGAAMPLAGGSYVFLREAYGPGRMGRLMSFLFVWQTLIQAPLSLASGAIGFSQYASYLYPLGTYGQKAVSGALVILLVVLLYRRISSIGKISLFLWVGVVGTILYLAMQTRILGVLPWQQAQDSPFIVSAFVEKLYGSAAARFATAMVLWIAFASVFSSLVGYSRVPYSAALDGNFFRIFARVHPEKKFPHISLLFLGALTFLFALLFKLKTVIAAVLAMRLIIQFIGQAVGVMLLRRRWSPERLPFKMWLYPLPALLTIAGWIWLFLRTGRAIWWGLFVIALGLVVFLVQARFRREWPFAAPPLEAAK